MRNRAAGLLIENGKLLLIHRIKKIDGVMKEYYVVPGGGIEENENIEMATIRELKEEVGIDVELLSNEPLLTLRQVNGNQYFSIIKKIGGTIGTGTGPEFTDPSYANMGFYKAEMIPIKDIIDGKINMVPKVIKDEFIRIINALNIDISIINSNNLLGNNSIII